MRSTHPRPVLGRALGVAAVATLLTLTACGSSDGSDGKRVDTTTAAGAGGACRTGDDAAKAPEPALDAPTAAATTLASKDLIVGCGAAIEAGVPVSVTVNYLGKAHSTGQAFDGSWSRGEPITFVVGAGRLIEGWDTGMVGMKEGGRRVLTIPGSMAYGPAGMPPDIGPDDTLRFVIDLIQVDA